jgi:hypothetical protein
LLERRGALDHEFALLRLVEIGHRGFDVVVEREKSRNDSSSNGLGYHQIAEVGRGLAKDILVSRELGQPPGNGL